MAFGGTRSSSSAPKGKKPFVASGVSERPEGAPNFNYNVSHEGDYVVLASELVCLVGVDVAAPGQSRKGGSPFDLDRVLKSFGSAFTRDELRNIECFGDPAAQDGAFRRNWSCKEAFTKARGDGVGFDLKRCEFTIEEAGEGLLPYTHTAEVSVDGDLLPGWSFLLQPLGDHWVTVARGPCSDVVDAHGEFTKTLSRRNLDPCGWRREAGAPRSGFEVVGVRDLLPADKLEGYDEIVGEDPFRLRCGAGFFSFWGEGELGARGFRSVFFFFIIFGSVLKVDVNVFSHEQSSERDLQAGERDERVPRRLRVLQRGLLLLQVAPVVREEDEDALRENVLLALKREAGPRDEVHRPLLVLEVWNPAYVHHHHVVLLQRVDRGGRLAEALGQKIATCFSC